MATEDPQFRLRLPEDLRDQIKAAAASNGRTINGEIVARLRAAFAEAPSLIDIMRAQAPDVLAMLDEIKAKVTDLKGNLD